MKHFLFIFLVFSTFQTLFAHESRPVYILIKQQNNQILISYSVPNTVEFGNLPQLSFPKTFRKDSTKIITKTNQQGFNYTEKYTGKIQNLKSAELRLIFPFFNPTLSTVVQIYFDNETPETYILSPENNHLNLVAKDKNSLKSRAFLGLGIEHIFKGFDHLLFVVCLLLITDFSKKLFWTITGFTLAHSLSIFMSVFGFVNIPVPFVEVCIALSIIFLCCEILKNYQQNDPSKSSPLTYKYPFLVSSAFGLLHGLGFAAVLKEIGLPENNLFASLLFFNVGVEIGQIAFIGFLFLGIFFLNYFFKSIQSNSSFLVKIATYLIGTIATFWFFERINAWYR